MRSVRLQLPRVDKKNDPWFNPHFEGAIGLAGIVLILQLFPNLATKMWHVVDIRHWSRLTWFVANIIVVMLLCMLRYGPGA